MYIYNSYMYLYTYLMMAFFFLVSRQPRCVNRAAAFEPVGASPS